MAEETPGVRIAAGLSTRAVASDAGAEAARAAAAELGGAPVDLAFCFLSPDHLDDVADAAEAVRELLAPGSLLGCVAGGVVGSERELETGPAAAVWAGSLPGAEVETFHAVAVEATDGVAVAGFPQLDDPAVVLLIVDPFTFPTGPFLDSLGQAHPGTPVVGGIAAGRPVPGGNALIVGEEIVAEGAVGAVVSGIPVATVVSQGCAPIGRDAVITAAEDNLILELAGRPALERLRDELTALSPREQQLARGGLLAGLVIDENRADYGRGDYLMRGLLGADDETGALAVGERVRVGQTLRFHVRDAASADEDLRESLAGSLAGLRPAGALLFTCNGRGTNMFDEPSHDARVIGDALGGRPLAGFFCGGEIGPVGGRTFLHGFTATLAVFLERPVVPDGAPQRAV